MKFRLSHKEARKKNQTHLSCLNIPDANHFARATADRTAVAVVVDDAIGIRGVLQRAHGVRTAEYVANKNVDINHFSLM